MSKRLTGAALNARVAATLRKELAEDYGLPMEEYDHPVISDSIGSDMQPMLEVVFTRRSNGLTVKVLNIWPGDDGTILQHGGNYGSLAY